MSTASDVGSVPFATLFLLITNITVHTFVFLTTFNAGALAISADGIIKGQIYRLLTSAFVHGSILHIFMNMSSLFSMGPMLESQFGSLSFFIMSIWAAIFGNIIYVSLYSLAWVTTGDYGYMHTSAVGYSGVLFTYACLESYHSVVSTRSFFGCFDVPSKIFPWLLLVAIQVILPNVSLVGHLAGMLFGVFLIFGGDVLLLPSPEYLEQIETSAFMSRIYRLPNYIRVRNKPYSIRNAAGTGSSPLTLIYNGCSITGNYVKIIVDAILFMLSCPPSHQICARMTQMCCNCCSPVRRFFESEHVSDAEGEGPPPLATRIQRSFTSGRDRDGHGSYAPVMSHDTDAAVPASTRVASTSPDDTSSEQKTFIV